MDLKVDCKIIHGFLTARGGQCPNPILFKHQLYRSSHVSDDSEVQYRT